MSSIQELRDNLIIAGRLKLRPLCVYGTIEIPQGTIPLSSIDRCIAKAVYTSALLDKTPPIYVDANQEQCCSGGMVWMGFEGPHPMLKYFVTIGTTEFHGGAAEHLKATPELFEEQRKLAGRITPPGKYIIIGPLSDEIEPENIKSIILFAGCEQIRNLCGLAQFSSSDPFFKTLIPGGATCSMMITFPSGMAENAPKDSAYIGPTDPTGNSWLPADIMIMGIPIALARKMTEDLNESFIIRRGRIAYPEKRVTINPQSGA